MVCGGCWSDLGIVECEITQWFVEPGARVEEFSPLCEVQSDKASVEITSRFAGVVKKLHYGAGDFAKVGKPLVDIDVDNENDSGETGRGAQATILEVKSSITDLRSIPLQQSPSQTTDAPPPSPPPPPPPKGKAAHIATPAVRHIAKTQNVDISKICGTGKDGRVLKEDIQSFVRTRDAEPSARISRTSPPPADADADADSQQETVLKMTSTQMQMFKTMTRSLSIPHFLYADEVDFSALHELRVRLNKVLALDQDQQQGTTAAAAAAQLLVARLTYLPFIIKAVSMALYKYPILNARVEMAAAAADCGGATESGKPTVILRSKHNIGVAMDTPHGLVVPVVHNVGALNILSIAAELVRLQGLATAGKLSPRDVSGGTITVSNIGGIGGTYLSPVIVEREVAILGVGRVRTVPAFADDHNDGGDEGREPRIMKKRVCNFSWSADHRVVDGATMARASEVVRRVVEEPDVMVMHLR